MIVILSLVRSNQENKCGFLRTTNRINVLLTYVVCLLNDFRWEADR